MCKVFRQSGHTKITTFDPLKRHSNCEFDLGSISSLNFMAYTRALFGAGGVPGIGRKACGYRVLDGG